jgi:hypothetical protein
MDLMTLVHDWETLMAAYKNAARGKRGHAPAANFEFKLADNLLELQHELQTQTYQPGAYHSFYIHEPKQRLISAAPFRDRVVHHALCLVTTPYFEKWFLPTSYANRVGKGTHAALDQCQDFARRFRYALPCDIEQFFPAMDHALLREILARMLPDNSVLWLIDRILASGRGVLAEEYTQRYFPQDDLWAAERPRGLPIGNLTSQWWANCYLNPLDQFVKRELRCPAYLRYVDDFILFSNDKAQLHEWRAAVVERLARYRLTIHAGPAQPRPVTEGLSFLGFQVFPTHRRLKARVGLAYRRKLKRLVRQNSAPAIKASVQGWINHVRYGQTFGLRRAVLQNAGLLAE